MFYGLHCILLYMQLILPLISYLFQMPSLNVPWGYFTGEKKSQQLDHEHSGYSSSHCWWIYVYNDVILYILIYLLTAIGLTPGGSSTVHIYTKTIHNTTQLTTLIGRLSGIRTRSGQTKINDELTT